jgi:hypothetical protein
MDSGANCADLKMAGMSDRVRHGKPSKTGGGQSVSATGNWRVVRRYPIRSEIAAIGCYCDHYPYRQKIAPICTAVGYPIRK